MTTHAVRRLSPGLLLLALLTVGGGAGAGLAADTRVGMFLGMLVGGFLLGVAVERRPLLEAAAAAVTAKLVVLGVAGVSGVGLTGAAVALGSIGLAPLTMSLALAGVAGGFGAHLGTDLHDGLTTPLDRRKSSRSPTETANGPTGTGRTRTGQTNAGGAAEGGDSTWSESPPDTEAERELFRQSTDE